MYLKGPSILRSIIPSIRGLSFLLISKPPLISVPIIISMKRQNNIPKITFFAWGWYLLSFSKLPTIAKYAWIELYIISPIIIRARSK